MTSGKSVAIFAQAISCLGVRGVFLVCELFWFCLVQVSTIQFCSFPFAFMANAHPFDDAEHANVPNSPIQELSSNFGSPNGSGPDLEGVVAPQVHWRPSLQKDVLKSNYISRRLHRFPCSYRDFTRFENSILSLTQSVASNTNNISNVEQAV